MQKLIELFWAIACRKRGPEDVPESVFLMQLTALGYLLVQLPLLLRQNVPAAEILLSVMSDILILVVFTWALLRLAGKSTRLVQTLTALFGTGVVIGVAAIPVGFLMYALADTELLLLPGLALLAILIWSVLVAGHIYARALSRSAPEGIVISLLYFLINYQLIQFVL